MRPQKHSVANLWVISQLVCPVLLISCMGVTQLDSILELSLVGCVGAFDTAFVATSAEFLGLNVDS